LAVPEELPPALYPLANGLEIGPVAAVKEAADVLLKKNGESAFA
jgi:hypothetical protein